MDIMKEVVNLCKNRGIIFQNSQIYGGLASTWDYGPLGVELKNNIKKVWWKFFIHNREDMVGLDSAILMHPRVWEASGHVKNFHDPLVDCKKCKERFRADHLIENILGISTAGMKNEELNQIIQNNQNIKCPTCGAKDFTTIRFFNLMFKTYQGPVEEAANIVYLRPETAQGIFINFKSVLNSSRKKIPFGVGQIGKAFRNEITPGNFIFRTREFEQMEIEYFVEPGTEMEHLEHWVDYSMKFFTKILGIKDENLRKREHSKDELAHYSNRTIDIEYKFPFGWGELEGIASRTDFDLSNHSQHSNEDLIYFDEKKNKKYIPYVVEPSFGVDRTLLTVLVDAYTVEKLQDGTERVVLKLAPYIAPIQVAVFPLKKNEPRIVEVAKKILKSLIGDFNVIYDDTASIGKLYRRQDEIGTPYCITVDFQSLEDNTVTVRNRDTMKQERVSINSLKEFFTKSFSINLDI
ncbi:MAG TPA: glycine--tRNA ligase [Spirochaetota bacterium]|nr:glycine--tRNA ligase [Spirochaetota bacterium]HOM37655.1 glycine--tRNA ligase [Spirochaetota bacterium]HPQ49613.1 glycine--tRNA ligase [Spirochaetota bacterium]